MTGPSTDASGDVSNTTAPRTTSGNDTFSRLRYSKSIVEQIREVASTAITSTDPKDYPAIHGRNGSRYMLEKWLDKRERRSWIGSHGFWLVEIDLAGKILRSIWCCSRCGNLFNSIATSNATIHLNKQHRVHESSEPSTATATATTSTSDIIIPRRKRGASTVAEMLRTNAVKRPKDPIFKTQADLFRHTFVNWMADSDIPFAVVESRHFRQILHMLNTTLTTALLPKGGDTMRSWLDEVYQEEFERIKSLLAAAPYKKHLSFDLWTSPGTVALLAVVVHYFSVLGTHQTHLLALPRIRGSHTGENIAVGVREVIEQFGLTDQLGYFQSDNMDSNDTCIAAVLAHYNPTLTARRITALKAIKRVRCTGHILNLVAKAFLEGDNKRFINSLDRESQARLSAEEERELLKEWRKSGPVGKLHVLVHWIRRSPQRRDGFSAIAKGQLLEEEREEFGAVPIDKDIAKLQLRADNATRWHSVYYMIDRALALRDPLEMFSKRCVRKAELEKESLLTHSDWVVLREIRLILEPFKIITKKFEGRLPNFPEVVSHMYTLHQNLTELYQQYSAAFDTPGFTSADLPLGREHTPPQEDPRPRTPPTPPTPLIRPRRVPRLPRHFADFEVELPALGYRQPPATRAPSPAQALEPVIILGEPLDDDVDDEGFNSIQSSLKLAIEKIEKYMELMDNTPAYWASMILLPDCRIRWVERFFERDPAKVASIKANFKQFFEQQYPPTAVTNVEPQPQVAPAQAAQRPGFGYGFFDSPDVTQHQDEVRLYLSEPVLPLNETPFQWWHRNTERFPRLSKMAFEILSIPPCSTECERTFSLAKLALSQQRQSTSDDTVSKLQCVKNWLRNEGT